MHLLLFLRAPVRFDTPERVDEVICAELLEDEELQALVSTNIAKGGARYPYNVLFHLL
jgi:hypothetical protein